MNAKLAVTCATKARFVATQMDPMPVNANEDTMEMVLVVKVRIVYTDWAINFVPNLSFVNCYPPMEDLSHSTLYPEVSLDSLLICKPRDVDFATLCVIYSFITFGVITCITVYLVVIFVTAVRRICLC